MRRYRCEICITSEDGHNELFLTRVRPFNFLERLFKKKNKEYEAIIPEYMSHEQDYRFPDLRIICHKDLLKKLTDKNGGQILRPVTYSNKLEKDEIPCFI